MFSNVIVGIDEQQGSRDAIALGKALMTDGGELTLAHVDLGAPTSVRDSNGASQEAERNDAISITSPSVGRGLHELAERQHADLVVLGSCRRGLIGRVFVGDDTRDALNGAPCAVAIAPAGYTERPGAWREIGVGYDGSPESRHALAMARELAVERGAKVSAFEAVSLPAFRFGGGAALIALSISGFVDQALARIVALGDVEPHAAYGIAAEELTVYSASLDLLLVGSRGYGPIGRLVHGSTSQQLSRTARCPLLVLTRASTADQVSDRTETGRGIALAAKA